MTKEKLYSLLDEMSLPDTVISMLDAPRWRFWRREAHIKEEELFPLLRAFLECRTRESETQIRENAYNVFAKLLLRSFEPEHCQFLVDRLNAESDKYVRRTMLAGIGRLVLPEGIDISPIITCSKSGEWMVRHNAIMALGRSNTDAAREAVRDWVRQEDEKQYSLELTYAHAALGYIGEPCDLPLLERHMHSHIRDVKHSAIYAINHIKQRFGMNELSEK